jgi:hypothetical protein
MEDHARAKVRVGPITLSVLFVCLAPGCAAMVNTMKPDPQASHPCNTLRASLALDTARFDLDNPNEPGDLVVGVYDVEGVVMQLAQVVLTLPPPADTLGFLYGASMGSDGVIRIARIRPARYQIKVVSLAFEDQTQNLQVIPARTDTLCFVMRSARMHLGSDN